MVFALVHFTVGFVCALIVLSLVPGRRLPLFGAFLGGIWALIPDGYHVLGGSLGRNLQAMHDTSTADWFFLHGTLDSPAFRAANTELTFLALFALGATLFVYDIGREFRVRVG
jgi:hypothetical protein